MDPLDEDVLLALDDGRAGVEHAVVVGVEDDGAAGAGVDLDVEEGELRRAAAGDVVAVDEDGEDAGAACGRSSGS